MTRLRATPAPTALSVTGLRVHDRHRHELLHGIDLTVAAGECVALVGDSGAGKSLLARAALGLLPFDLQATADQHLVVGRDMHAASERTWRTVHGHEAGYVHQDALGALDPLMRIGAQTQAPLNRHHIGDRGDRPAAVLAALERAGLDADRVVQSWPHQLSGGMRQRALIAGALVGGPQLLVADEPTTALDATVQRRVLEMLRAEVDRGTALLFVSHDLAAVAGIADRVVVLSDGRVVECGSTAELLTDPQHEVTRNLLAASGSSPRRAGLSPVQKGASALDVSDLAVRHPGAPRNAVAGVTFTLARGRTLGVLGESGAGKSSLAAALLGTRRASAGRILLDGLDWGSLSERQRRGLRHRIQLVPQSAPASFSPGVRVGQVLSEALRSSARAQGQPRPSRHRVAARARELLQQVGLTDALTARPAGTLSGGQAQRLAIARALACEPDVLVCDEAVSALDATVQAKVLDLLEGLQRETGVAMVFISHDVEAIRRVSDDLIILKDGAVVEQGLAERVLAEPRHAFTRELLAAASPLH